MTLFCRFRQSFLRIDPTQQGVDGHSQSAVGSRLPGRQDKTDVVVAQARFGVPDLQTFRKRAVVQHYARYQAQALSQTRQGQDRLIACRFCGHMNAKVALTDPSVKPFPRQAPPGQDQRHGRPFGTVPLDNTWSRHEDQRSLADRETVHTGHAAFGKSSQGQINTPFAQYSFGICGVSSLHRELEFWMLQTQSGYQRRKDGVASGDRRVDSQGSSESSVERIEALTQQVAAVKRVLGKRQEAGPCGGERDAAGVTVKQTGADFFFEANQDAAKGGRACVDRLGGPSEMLMVGQGDKGLKFREIQRSLLLRILHYATFHRREVKIIHFTQ